MRLKIDMKIKMNRYNRTNQPVKPKKILRNQLKYKKKKKNQT